MSGQLPTVIEGHQVTAVFSPSSAIDPSSRLLWACKTHATKGEVETGNFKETPNRDLLLYAAAFECTEEGI